MGGTGPGPAVVIRRLGPGDVHVLETLARDDADFDLDGGRGARTPLTSAAAKAYLADPHVLHWTAWAGGEVVGSLFCHVLPMRKEPARELLLYEIGVRSAWRRRGVGRQLAAAMTAWMQDQGLVTAWVLADNPGAVRFYEACGFGPGSGPATYLELRI
ncbi:MAG TPA: GNAT family N-acetyltransferase [Myxococcaceae bacterium]|nr:GNAT family N-acetyltransferase [Myxococcaceae bacterium]